MKNSENFLCALDFTECLGQARDEIFVSIQKYQAIRETIKNVTVRAPSKKRNECKRIVFHEIYLELKGRLLKEKQSVKILSASRSLSTSDCCDERS
jgi:hypothetical protein